MLLPLPDLGLEARPLCGPGLRCPPADARVFCLAEGGDLARQPGRASVLTCLSSQAPALQQYRASAGSPANQSPTSPVSNQGFSPGSSPQVRDAAPPPTPAWLAPPAWPLCTCPASVPPVSAHAIVFTPSGWGPVRRSRPTRAKEQAPSPRSSHFPTAPLQSVRSPCSGWRAPHSRQ